MGKVNHQHQAIMSRKIIKGDIETGGGKGVGNVSPAMVRERAIQLAVIDGRKEDEMTQHDLDRAEKELRDDDRRGAARHDLPRELGDSALAGDPTPSPGREAASRPFDDDANTSKELVQQGMDEALHDEMLEAGKQTLTDARETRGGSDQTPKKQ